MTDQPVPAPDATSDVTDPLPSADELGAGLVDGSGGAAVSAQPTDTDPADLADARERVEWDADTDPTGGA